MPLVPSSRMKNTWAGFTDRPPCLITYNALTLLCTSYTRPPTAAGGGGWMDLICSKPHCVNRTAPGSAFSHATRPSLVVGRDSGGRDPVHETLPDGATSSLPPLNNNSKPCRALHAYRRAPRPQKTAEARSRRILRPKSTITSSPELNRRVADEPTTPPPSPLTPGDGQPSFFFLWAVPGPRGPYVMQSLYVKLRGWRGPARKPFRWVVGSATGSPR